MILIVHAHPYPQRSRACRALLDAVRDLPDLEIRSLYDLYPDFDIDVPAEQEALARADLIVWLNPIYWYSVPGMLKHWFDVVLSRGWAFGEGGGVLQGKHCLWVATTGGPASSFADAGVHQRPFDEFVAPVRHTARFCGMEWETPVILHGAHLISDDELAAAASSLRDRLFRWLPDPPGAQEIRRSNDFE